MFFHTIVCGTCGWSFGPSRNWAVKQMKKQHREMHEKEMRNDGQN